MSTARGMLTGGALSILSILLSADCAQSLIVIDGDTLRRGAITYRLHGIDAPETRRPKCAAERELGIRAKARMEQLATESGGNIEALPGREKYGRTLARLWVRGKDAGQIMLAEGLAQPYAGRKKPDWCLEQRTVGR
jgi:micrococcal nuclease